MPDINQPTNVDILRDERVLFTLLLSMAREINALRARVEALENP